MVDAGYALETGYMDPFKNTRYHLDDFRGVDMDTLSRQEKFNFTLIRASAMSSKGHLGFSKPVGTYCMGYCFVIGKSKI